jgi:LmbE family N-acetylglucosaminyl deacetylase
MTAGTTAASRRTLVAFHAHPDDEVLLTGGTLAKAAAAGHRVVLVSATAGSAGLADDSTVRRGLGAVRTSELRSAASLLGCQRVELLGYEDSGYHGLSGGADSFVRAPVAEAAERLARLLVEEHADILTVYDANGGYGHPDHVRVHEVGVLAAQLAGTPRVLQATVDRDQLLRAVRTMRALRLGRGISVPDLESSYLPRRELTHRIDVRDLVELKRAAMAMHVSQTRSGSADDRTLALLLRLPRPVARVVLGREWFAERGAAEPNLLESDLFVPAGTWL